MRLQRHDRVRASEACPSLAVRVALAKNLSSILRRHRIVRGSAIDRFAVGKPLSVGHLDHHLTRVIGGIG